jgi:hypothetical protein
MAWIRVSTGKGEGEPHPTIPTRGGERVGGTSGIRPGHHPHRVRIARPRPGIGGHCRQRRIEHRDVIGRGVRPGVTRAQQPGQGFATGDLRTVQKRQQRMKTTRLLPRLGRVLLVLRVRDRDRGIEVNLQQPRQVRGRARSPRPLSGRRPRGTNAGHMRRIDPIQHPPRGRHRRHRPAHLVLIAEYLNVGDTVRTISDRYRHINEYLPRRRQPRTRIRIRQRLSHSGYQPGIVRQFPQHSHPGMRGNPDTISADPHPP